MRCFPSHRGRRVASVAAALLLAGCTALLGDDYQVVGATGGGPVGEAGSATTTTGTGGTAAGGSTASGGGGGGGGVAPCGNGEPDPGEICDGDCPQDCVDAELCTADTMAGRPDDCNVSCSFIPIATCVNNDGCCPNGCYNSLDNDCDLRVLVVSAFANGYDALASALNASGQFGSVDVFPAGGATPTLAQLQASDAVIVSTNYDPFYNAVALGDVLADYYDQGGRVVLANGANCSSYALGGRFVTGDYLALAVGNINPGDDPLGVVHVANTPLMAGSDGFVGYAHCDGAGFPGAVVVASYETSGDPVVAYRWVQGRRRVDLNIFPPPDSGAEGVALIVNALKFQ